MDTLDALVELVGNNVGWSVRLGAVSCWKALKVGLKADLGIVGGEETRNAFGSAL